MIKWITNIHWGKVLFVGCFYTVFACISQYVLRQQLSVVFFIDAYITGVSITIIYYYLRDYLPKGLWRRATYFTDLLIATSFIFFTLPCYLLFNLPAGLLGYWFVSTFVTLLATSLFIVKVIS